MSMSDLPIHAVLAAAYVLLGLSVSIGLYVLVATPALIASTLGERGRKRQRALAQGGSFALLEPAIRKVAGWVSRFELAPQRAQLERLLRASGYVLGATPDELIAMMLMSSIGATAVTFFVLSINHSTKWWWLPVGSAIGFFLPSTRVRDATKQRQKSVNRGLPIAIDLVSLCVGAGTDFPSALKFVVGEMTDEGDATREEFVHIVQQLEVGHTRSHALAMFAERVPTPSVRDFVNAVTQAEEKGTPLAQVLAIQARVLRMRRSVAAEEAAARAGVMLIGPLMLQLCAIMVILFSPFIINGLGF